MNKSEQINELATAMSKLQSETKGADKGANNPYFKSKYTTLENAWDSIRELLGKYGLSILQNLTTRESSVAVTTMVTHSSGQWLEFGPLDIPIMKKDPQSVGSACSYAKRYSLCAAVGIVSSSEDDDGEAAMKPYRKQISKEDEEYVDNCEKIQPIEKPISFAQFCETMHQRGMVFTNQEMLDFLNGMATDSKKPKEKIMAHAIDPQNFDRFAKLFNEKSKNSA